MIARQASARVGVWHHWDLSVHAQQHRDHYRGGPADPSKTVLRTRCGRAWERRGNLLPGAAVTCKVCIRMLAEMADPTRKAKSVPATLLENSSPAENATDAN